MLDNILISFDYFIRAYYRVEKVAATDLINLQIMVSICYQGCRWYKNFQFLSQIAAFKKKAGVFKLNYYIYAQKLSLEYQFPPMTDRIHKSLMSRTQNSLKTLKMAAQILKQMRQQVPFQMLMQSLARKETEFKQELMAKGIVIDKSFDDVVRNMKNINFDIMKQIERNRKNLEEYYENSEETKEGSSELTIRKIPKRKLLKKSKRVIKQKKRVKQLMAVKDPIYESSEEDVDDHFGVN